LARLRPLRDPVQPRAHPAVVCWAAYDVISPAQRAELLRRTAHVGGRFASLSDDVAEQNERDTRRAHLGAGLKLGILVRDEQPGYLWFRVRGPRGTSQAASVWSKGPGASLEHSEWPP